MGDAKPCTAPSAALANARPPHKLPNAISVLASTSSPWSNARRNARATRGNASRQMASVRGLAFTETYGSISCVRASIPVDAVSAGGSASVSSGSTTASAGNINGLRRLTFWWLSRHASGPRSA